MTAVFACIGLIGAIATTVVSFAGQVDWGPPGTPEYATYELVNRVTGLALLLLAFGPAALRGALAARGIGGGSRAFLVLAIAFVGMAAGSAAEFVLFSDAPYSGDGSLSRNLSFIGFEVSGVVVLIAGVIAGIQLWRDPSAPRLVAGAVLAAVPVGIALALFGAPVLIAIPLVGLATSGSALMLTGRATASPVAKVA